MRNFFYLCVSSIFYGFFVIQGRQIFSICFNHVLNDVVDSCVDVFISILFLIMEKLIELFNERINQLTEEKHDYDKFEMERNLNRLDLLKQFIKWLVEKDKIDFSIMRINAWYELYENFIMYLSIQDDPIKYLISYLK